MDWTLIPASIAVFVGVGSGVVAWRSSVNSGRSAAAAERSATAAERNKQLAEAADHRARAPRITIHPGTIPASKGGLFIVSVRSSLDIDALQVRLLNERDGSLDVATGIRAADSGAASLPDRDATVAFRGLSAGLDAKMCVYPPMRENGELAWLGGELKFRCEPAHAGENWEPTVLSTSAPTLSAASVTEDGRGSAKP